MPGTARSSGPRRYCPRSVLPVRIVATDDMHLSSQRCCWTRRAVRQGGLPGRAPDVLPGAAQRPSRLAAHGTPVLACRRLSGRKSARASSSSCGVLPHGGRGISLRRPAMRGDSPVACSWRRSLLTALARPRPACGPSGLLNVSGVRRVAIVSTPAAQAMGALGPHSGLVVTYALPPLSSVGSSPDARARANRPATVDWLVVALARFGGFCPRDRRLSSRGPGARRVPEGFSAARRALACRGVARRVALQLLLLGSLGLSTQPVRSRPASQCPSVGTASRRGFLRRRSAERSQVRSRWITRDPRARATTPCWE